MNSVEKVKAICKERHIPISRLERDCGFSNGYINQLRRGVFTYDRLIKIADYLGISPSEIANGEKEKTAIPEDDGNRQEFIRAWDEASPEQRALALATLKLTVSPAGSQEKPNP